MLNKKKIILILLSSGIIAGSIGYKGLAEENKDVDKPVKYDAIEDYTSKSDSQTETKTSNMKLIEDGITKKEYEDIFKIKRNEIKNIVGNGGQYASSSIDKAIDGNKEIWFETGRPNSENFKNEVTVTFNKSENIDKISYSPRPGNKGYLQEYKIYGSNDETGDNFTLLVSGKGAITGNETEINFKPTNVKRIKIVFEKANEDWAAIGEIGFYRTDSVLNESNDIFADNLETKLNNKYKDVKALDDLNNKIASHPLKVEISRKIERAKEILNGDAKVNKVFKPKQLGDIEKISRDNFKINYGTNLQPLGIYANPGDEIVVYVETGNTLKMPKLVATQHVGEWSNWKREFDLKPGRNVIKIPQIYNDNWTVKTNKGGPLYISNPYTSEDQGAISMRIEGGKEYPIFKKGDSVEGFIEQLKSAKQKKNSDTTGKYIDVVELMGRRELFTLRTDEVYDIFVNQKKNPEEILNTWDGAIDEIIKFSGLDGNTKTTDGSKLYETFRVMQPFAFMYAAGDHIGFQAAQQSALLDTNSIKSGSWGFFHEIGHNFEIGEISWSEISNNLIPVDKITRKDNFKLGDERIDWQKVYNKVALNNGNQKYDDFGTFDKIAVFWQLELAKPGYWAEMNKYYRENNLKYKGDNWKVDNFVAISSELLGKNLTEYFSKYGFNISENVKNDLAKYPKLENKLWYLNSSSRFYNGSGFNKEQEIFDVKINDENTINFNINSKYQDDLLGYEIIKNGEVIGFTNQNSFTDVIQEGKKGGIDNFEIIPYAKNLSIGKSMKFEKKSLEVKSIKPTIEGLEDLKVEVGTRPDLKKGVIARDNKDNDITTNIVLTGNANFDVPGKYTIRYLIRDNEGNSASYQRVIEVIPKTDEKKEEDTTKKELSTKNELKIVYKDGESLVVNGVLSDLNLTNKIKKELIIENANNIKSKIIGANVNWYASDKENYNGYQFILNRSVIDEFQEGDNIYLMLENEGQVYKIKIDISKSINAFTSKDIKTTENEIKTTYKDNNFLIVNGALSKLNIPKYVNKELVIVDKNNSSKSIIGANVNWYSENKENYNGYQFAINNELVNSLNAGAKAYIKFDFDNNKYEVPVNIK